MPSPSWTALLTLAALHGTALGSPPPPPDEILIAEDDRRPLLEWSTWVRAGYGVETVPVDAVARTVTPPRAASDTRWDAAVGADATLPLTDAGDARVGAWIEARGFELFAGGELTLTAVPRKLDLFFYEGQGQLAVRFGGNADRGTVALAYGYRAPWDLWGAQRGAARYMIGVRLVATATRAHDDPRDWQASLGVEFEPVGALRYLFGIRAWY